MYELKIIIFSSLKKKKKTCRLSPSSTSELRSWQVILVGAELKLLLMLCHDGGLTAWVNDFNCPSLTILSEFLLEKI